MGKRKKAGKQQENKKNIKEQNLDHGLAIVGKHPLFGAMGGSIWKSDDRGIGKGNAGVVTKQGEIILNREYLLAPEQWAYVAAHCMLHLAFGHFDQDRMPGPREMDVDMQDRKRTDSKPGSSLLTNDERYLWNMACDIYVAKFLADIKFGSPVCSDPRETFAGSLADELAVYKRLLEICGEKKGDADRNGGNLGLRNSYGTAGFGMDMRGLESPAIYDKKKGEENRYAARFAYALSNAVTDTVRKAGCGETVARTAAEKAAQWFVNHYPLLGGLASSFKIIEDYERCMAMEIQIAAVNAEAGEIYINPAAGLWREEWKFVLAHEFLHAGLGHQKRREGRDAYLWNVACDFVVNGWLVEMAVGKIPDVGLLYDESLKNKSAEEIYDFILSDMRKYLKMATFRGYGKGDILPEERAGFGRNGASGMKMDEFCKRALAQGLSYQQSFGRGVIPAGLIAEIRALSMPPIPWDVELARWFEEQFPYQEKKRTYARPSRRQGSTPDIPRPRYVKDESFADGRTFGVVVDTSGSMGAKTIGMALGSIASYAAVREVSFVRVVFCDAAAYDAGYMSPEEIAGRVEVKGRGGTRLQPGVDLLENAKDFPKDGPILLITDGEIEDRMTVHRNHAFLIPKGRRLPFRAGGKVFYFA